MERNLEDLLRVAASMEAAFSAHLEGLEHEGSLRAVLAASLAAVSIEHGRSLQLLVEADHLVSATALLRVQLESTVRGIWIRFGAEDAWLERYVNHRGASPGPVKDPNFTPGMDEMIREIGQEAPEEVGRMLAGFKAGAWAPLNSYVHSGIHSIYHALKGHHEAYAIQTLRNSCGLTGMAAMLRAELSGLPGATQGVKDIQLAHRDCLPPLVSQRGGA